MKLQIVTEEKNVWLRLLEENDQLVGQKKLEGGFLSEKLLGELDKLLKENKIEKIELTGIEALPKDEDGSSARIARIVSLAGGYCLTK